MTTTTATVWGEFAASLTLPQGLVAGGDARLVEHLTKQGVFAFLPNEHVVYMFSAGTLYKQSLFLQILRRLHVRAKRRPFAEDGLSFKFFSLFRLSFVLLLKVTDPPIA